jgi:hypothetical protein
MFPSAEIRWFNRGEVPATIRKWFYGLDGQPDLEPTRTDHYLRLPDSTSMGLKLRENRIEFKQRTGKSEKLDIPAGLSGMIEYYQKWSFPVNHPEAVEETLKMYGDSWIAIEKSRAIHRYRFADHGVSLLENNSIILEQGCGLELTIVNIGGQNEKWWTLGFEAFGDKGGLKTILMSVMNMVIDQYGLPDPGANISCGYAEWLQKNYLSQK